MGISKSQIDQIVAFLRKWEVPDSVVNDLKSSIILEDAELESDAGFRQVKNENECFGEPMVQKKPAHTGLYVPDAGQADSTQHHESHPSTNPIPEGEAKKYLGKYEDLGLLGVGGMGEVRRVRDPDLHRIVAMKIMHERMLNKPRLVSRFIEEAQVEAQLQHVNIVPVHEIGQLPDGRHYFTMQQIRGTEFSHKINSVHASSTTEEWRPGMDGTSFRDLVRFFHQVCETVSYAHSQGVIHRDLKPENIMIGNFGEVLVVDWGLAKVLNSDGGISGDDEEGFVETDRSRNDSHLTQAGTVAGTPCYMAPEQAFGNTDQLGTPTDVYTLGVILYQLLTGRPPFDGGTSKQVLEMVKHGVPPPVRITGPETVDLFPGDVDFGDWSASPADDLEMKPNPKIPEHLAQLCESAMKREPSARLESAQLFANEVKAWLEGAEKRDKALAALAAAREILDSATIADAKAAQHWEAANDLLESEGPSSTEGWHHWDEHVRANAECVHAAETHARKLQAILVDAPDFREAHTALANLRVRELLEAAAVGDKSKQEAVQLRLRSHLQFLSETGRKEVHDRMNAGLSDEVTRRRLRRGALVGRHKQRDEIASKAQSGARFLNLRGTAGVGKTRLALEVAEDLRDGFQRTLFCDLTEVRDELGVVIALSRVMDIRLHDEDPVGHLAQAITSQSTLLVLDNLEHLSAVIGPMINDWTTRTNSLQVLGTSRIKLNIDPEVVVNVRPLSVLGGVSLFVQRGQMVNKRFALTKTNRAMVCSLVQKMDGLPLAIELAASRLAVFEIEELVQRLDERFSLLRSRGREAQALDTAFDWSWELLDPATQAVLAQASIFRGGFSLSAAESIMRIGDHHASPAMFDILGALVDNSLLQADQESGDEIRYSLLDTIREYATQKLNQMHDEVESPASLKRVQHRHAEYFGQLGTFPALQSLSGFESQKHWATLFRELDNLVVAIGHGDTNSASLCCLAALQVFTVKGPMSLGIELTTQTLMRDDLSWKMQSMIEIGRGRCLRISGRLAEARQMVTPELGRKAPHANDMTAGSSVEGNPLDTAENNDANRAVFSKENIEVERLKELAMIETQLGNQKEAMGLLQQALRIAKQTDDRVGQSAVLSLLGVVCHRLEQNERAEEMYQEGLRISRVVGDKRVESRCLGNLGNIYRNKGKIAEALESYQHSLQLSRDLGDERSESIQVGNLGLTYLSQGRSREAIEAFELTVAMSRKVGDVQNQAIYTGNLGLVHIQLKDYSKAIDAFKKAVDIAIRCKDVRTECAHLGNLGDAYVENNQFDEAEASFRKCLAIAEKHHPLAETIFRGSFAVLLARTGRVEEAKAVLETSELPLMGHREERTKFIIKTGLVQTLANEEQAAKNTFRRACAHAKTLSDVESAYVEQALSELATALGESIESAETSSSEELHGEALRLMELGKVEVSHAQRDVALSCFEQALALFRAHGDKVGEANALRSIADILDKKGDLERAVQLYTMAIAVAREVGDRASEGVTMGNLAGVYATRREYARAASLYESAIEIAQEFGDKRNASGSMGNLATIHHRRGNHVEAIALYEKAIKLAQEVGWLRCECMHLGNLSGVYLQIDRVTEALEVGTKAVLVARQLGDDATAAILNGNVGNIDVIDGRYDEALERFTESVEMSMQARDKVNEYISRANVGRAQMLKGDFFHAMKSLETSIEMASETDDRLLVGIGTGILGKLMLELGRPMDARPKLEKAIDMIEDLDATACAEFRGALAITMAHYENFEDAYRQIGMAKKSVVGNQRVLALLACDQAHSYQLAGENLGAQAALAEAEELADKIQSSQNSELRRAIGKVQHPIHGTGGMDVSTTDESGWLEANRNLALGRVEKRNGNLLVAIEHSQQALDGFERLADARGKLFAMASLANFHEIQGDFAASIVCYEEAIELARTAGDQKRVGILTGNMAGAYQSRGKYPRSMELHKQAIEMTRSNGDKANESNFLGNLGNTHVAMGEYSEAIDLYNQSLAIAKDLGSTRQIAIRLGNLADMYDVTGDFDKAVEHFNEAIKGLEKLGDTRMVAILKGNLGNCHLDRGNYGQSIELFHEATLLSKRVGDRRHQGINLGNLGDALCAMGRFDAAEKPIRKAIDIVDGLHPVASGAFRGSLAWLLAHQGQMDAAMVAIDDGEPLVGAHPVEHAKFLCKKGHVQSIYRDRSGAKASLAEAAQLVQYMEFTENHHIMRTMTSLKESIDSMMSGIDGKKAHH